MSLDLLEKTLLLGVQQEVYIKEARGASTESCNSFFALLRELSRWNYLAVVSCRYGPLAVIKTALRGLERDRGGGSVRRRRPTGMRINIPCLMSPDAPLNICIPS